MTYEEIFNEMSEYNREVAYGSECNAWQDFMSDSFRFGYDLLEKPEEIVDEEFRDYWLDAAERVSIDYVPETGARRED